MFPALLVPQFPLGTLFPQQPWSLGVCLQGTAPLPSQLLRGGRAAAPRSSAGCEKCPGWGWCWRAGMESLCAGEEVTVAGCLCWLRTRCWRVLRVVSLCLGLQSPVVISANCNYLLPAVRVETNRLFPEKLLFVFPARVPGRKSALPGKGDWHHSAWGVCLWSPRAGSGLTLPKASRVRRNWEFNAVSYG